MTLLGSLCEGSFNAAIARSLPHLAPEGMTARLGGRVPPYDADLQAEGFPAPVLAMAGQIGDADGVVIVPPEYDYSVPGALKNAIDWLSRVKPQPLVEKPVAIQTASPGAQGESRAQYHLRQSFVFLEALVLKKPEVMVAGVDAKMTGEPSELRDQATRDIISRQLQAFANSIRRVGPR